MKKSPRKNITLDDLALMVGNGFNAVDKRFATVESELNNIKGVLKKNNHDILNIKNRFVPRHEFDTLFGSSRSS